MKLHAMSVLIGAMAAVAMSGCGGRTGGDISPAVPQPAVPNAGLQSGTRTYSLTGAAGSYAFAPVGGFSGSLALPAASVPPQTSLQLSTSLDAPADAPLLQSGERRMQSTGTLSVYFYTRIVLSNTVTYPSPPGFAVTLPATVSPAGLAFYYAISNPTPSNGAKVQYRTEGPATVSGQVVTFAPSTTPLTLLAGQSYTVALYAVTSAKVGASKIYVTNYDDNTVTTYNADGTRSTPTITAGITTPVGVAVDAAGKIFVVSYGNNRTVTTYNADGTPSTPTITAGLTYPVGIAVDAAGKIYVTNAGVPNMVTTYNADGSRSTPTITAGLGRPGDVAVDAAGKIYVGNFASDNVTTYDADGTQTTPTITAGIRGPEGVAVDAAGKIYVASINNNTVTTYNADGTPSTPTITDGLNNPAGIAIDAAGKIYVTNLNNTVTTYNADGSRSAPTITAGLGRPLGVAVR